VHPASGLLPASGVCGRCGRPPRASARLRTKALQLAAIPCLLFPLFFVLLGLAADCHRRPKKGESEIETESETESESEACALEGLELRLLEPKLHNGGPQATSAPDTKGQRLFSNYPTPYRPSNMTAGPPTSSSPPSLL
jgi:hypothetical protein